LVTDDRFEVVAVCSANAARAEQAAQTFDVPRFYSDLGALVSGELPDAIVLATPPDVTPRLLRIAVAAELPVLVEKPGAATAAELRNAIDSPGTHVDRPPRVSVAYNRRYQRHVYEGRRIVSAGELGPLRDLKCQWRAPFLDRYTLGDTYRRRLTRGHGVLLDTGCHVVDTLLFLGLGPLSVTAARLVTAGGLSVGADVEAHLGLAGVGGVPCTIDIEDGPEEDWSLTVRGEQGSMLLTRTFLETVVDGCTQRMQHDDLARPIEDLVRLSTGDSPYGASVSAAARCLTVLEAARTASSPGKPWLRPRAKALGRLNGSC
jgi:predicted dehydrogenase